MTTRTLLIVALLTALSFGLSDLILAQGQAEPTREETLLQQIGMLQAQLSICESQGSSSTRLMQSAQQTMQQLRQSLESHGLTLDSQGQIVPKPVESNVPAPQPPKEGT